MSARRGLTGSMLALGALAAVVLAPATGVAPPTLAAQVGVDHGSWADVGPMSTSRGAPTMVRLHSGRVLVFGGRNTDASVCKRATELFDPATNNWSRADLMRQSRCQAGVVVLRGGQVLVAGGEHDSVRHHQVFSVDRRTVEIYRPATHQWGFTTPMHIGRAGAVTALLPHGHVLVAGGYNMRLGALRSTEIYNPRTQQWRRAAPMNAPWAGGDSVRLPGGDVLAVEEPRGPSNVHIVERYVVGHRVWRPAGQFRSNSRFHLFLLPTGKVLAIAAFSGQTRRYNPATNQWHLGARLPLPLRHLYVSAVVSLHREPLVLASSIRCPAADSVGVGYLWRPRLHEWVRWTTIPRPLVDYSALRLRGHSILVAGGSTYNACVTGAGPVFSRSASRYYPDR